METYSLICHPDTPPTGEFSLSVSLKRAADRISAWFVIEGAVRQLVLPSAAKPYRTDGLWQTTCCELFLLSAQGAYIEFNFSPSSEWAAYAFESYRSGMANLQVDDPPQVICTAEKDHIIIAAHLAWNSPSAFALSLSAVIEELDGTKSYWALAHPPGQPDFHHPACFTATLPAPKAA